MAAPKPCPPLHPNDGSGALRVSLAVLLLATAAHADPTAVAPAVPAAVAAVPRAAAAEPFESARALLAQQSEARVARLRREGAVMLPRDAAGAPPGFGGFRALVLFSAPPERVMRLMSQTARQVEYRPELREIEPLRSGPGGQVDEHRIRILFTTLAYRVRSRIDFEHRTIRWSLDPDFDNDLRRVEGFWHFHPLADGGTLGHFGTVVDVGAGLPGFLQDAITRKHLPAIVGNTRRWVESDGRWRP